MSSFTPRLTEPDDFTTYYGSHNAWNRYANNYPENNSGGNCTWYAYGRTGEISGINIYDEFRITSGSGDGKDWIHNTWPDYTFTEGDIDIHEGDILVYGGGTYGHVEVVEQILDDGSGNKQLKTSYSIYGSSYAKSRFFGTRVINYPYWNMDLGTIVYNDGTSAYLTNKFIGYIHNPYVKNKKPFIYRRGDYVKIIATGRAQANGKGRIAYGVGFNRRIIKVYESQPYPYRVGYITGETTGYYKQNALQLIRRG